MNAPSTNVDIDAAAFTNRDWQRIEETWTAWWAGELDRPIIMLQGKATGPDVSWFTSNFPLDMPVDDVLNVIETDLARTRWYGDAFPKWWPNFGPGILAAFLGCKVKTAPDTVWFEPADDRPLAEIDITFDESNIWWQRITALQRRALERWQGRVCVGFTDIGGNLDVLASLRGSEQLAMDLLDDPDTVDRLVACITAAWLDCYQRQHAILTGASSTNPGTTPWAAIWSPARCYMLQCDFAYMISPQHFDRFVVPDLTRCCDMLDHGFYHLDGIGQIPHVDSLLAIERLRGIQWIPGDGQPGHAHWLDLLARIRDGGKLVQIYTNPDDARTIVQQLGGRGFVLCIHGNFNPHQAQQLLAELTP